MYWKKPGIIWNIVLRQEKRVLKLHFEKAQQENQPDSLSWSPAEE